MNPVTSCPSTQELQALLSDSSLDERREECVRHLDACHCCQAKLEELAVDGTNLTQLCEQMHAATPQATSAYWPVLKALEAGGGVGAGENTATAVSDRTRNVALHFLQPPTDGAYLGRLAHFDVMRLIGRGGMGLVLEAFDSRLQRNVALKVLDPALADDEVARARFCREARAAASITHENVVAVHQVEKFDDGKLAYMVMQLVAGESLEQRLARDQRLPLREIVRIGMQAAHGLAAAHAQGLIHRDVKPGNILLEPPHDRVKLTDFGLARVADDVKLTQTGFVSGTPLYMAPEQARGEEPDPRSDLFSLGAILYEMCAGRPPFLGNSALAILRQITEIKQPPLRQLNPQAPEWLAETIDRLLAKKPDDRFQSAAHLAELLEFQWALMKTSSEDVPTVCAQEERRRTVRNRWIAAGIGAAFLLVGLLAGIWFNRAGGSAGPSVVSSAEPTAVLTAKAGAVWSVSFDAAGDTVAMAVEDGSVRLWDLPTKSTKATLGGHRGTVWVSLFSPSGRRLMTAGNDSLIKLWDPAAPGAPVATLQHGHTARGAAFSRDEQTLFAADEGGVIRAWNLETSQPIAEAEQPGTVYAVALSPDGATLATAGSDKTVRLWNAKTLSQKLPLEGHDGPIYGLSFHPAGGRLASVGWDKTVRIWDAASGSLVKSWEAHAGDVWSVAYSSDGAKLVTGGTDGAVKLWNAETGALRATYLGHPSAVHTVAFNRIGTQIASGGRDGAVRIWIAK
jgi:eukaryotic-like serine/threonine-protein kinase